MASNKETSKQEVSLPALAICSFLLWAKMFVTLVLQGSKSQRPPEDLNKTENGSSSDLEAGGDHDNTADVKDAKDFILLESKFTLSERWNRIVRNDLENIPMALILAWGSYVADTETFGNTYNYCVAILICLFTFFRFGHTVCYAKRIQPWRSICYLTSQLCQCGFAILLLIEGINAITG